LLTTKEGSIIIVVLVLLMLLPFIYSVRWFNYSINNDLVFTPDLPSVKAITSLKESFSPGMIYPFYLEAEAKNPEIENGTFTEDFFDLVPKIIKELETFTNGDVQDNGVITAAAAYGMEVPFEYAKELIDPSSTAGNSSYAELYRGLLKRVVSRDPYNSSSLFIISVAYSPITGDTIGFVRDVRNLTDKWTNTTRFTWTFSSILVSLVDVTAISFRQFPFMVIITFSAIIIFIAIAFRFLLLPLRLAFTIGITLLWTYGTATLLFCTETIIKTPKGSINGLYWFVPVFAFTIIAGLGIDYDIFLFCRVTEERRRGHSSAEAIRRGYYHTGSVITGAGIVMSIAFSGLVFSAQRVLQQLGFFLSASVLLDTFVIRMLLVPALLYWLGDANWWPRKMPKFTYNPDSVVSVDNAADSADV